MGRNKLWAWYPHLPELYCSAQAVTGIIKDWKDGAKVALVNSQRAAFESRNTILETAHGNYGNCVAVIVSQVKKRERRQAMP
jgi:hypothetical protein